MTSKERRLFPQVEIDSLEELSVPRLVSGFLAMKLGELSFEDYVKAGRYGEACNKINEAAGHAEELERYLEYLVTEMESLKNELNAVKRKFTNWLRVASGSDIENWEGKSGLEDFHSNSFDSLVEIFRRNEDQSILKPTKRAGDLQTLRQNFESSVESATPLTQKLNLMDNLSDLIVYGLYGLSVEHIAQIEGTKSEFVRSKYSLAR